MSAPSAEQLLRRNEEYAQTHQPQNFISERQSLGILPPKTFVVTCIDARVVPEFFLKLNSGGMKSRLSLRYRSCLNSPLEALVHRNAGGHVRKALSDLLALDTLVRFENLFVIHHNDCGTTYFDEDKIRGVLCERASEHQDEIKMMDFGKIVE